MFLSWLFPQAFSKVCCRCGAEYKVNASGNCVRKEECNHHWGRLRRYKGKKMFPVERGNGKLAKIREVFALFKC